MSDAESDKDLPTADECEERCQQFAKVTGTDTALAMFYLQDRDWNVERSLNAFFESGNGAVSEKSEPAKDKSASEAKDTVDPQPHRIRLLSWNIDGLDPSNVKTRAKAVSKIILAENPDVVFLQELVSESQEVIEKKCPQYQLLPGGDEGYYTAVMLKATSVQLEDHSVQPFYSSVMARNLLKLKAKVKGVDMLLMTSHLESMKDHAAERQRQLKIALKEVVEAEPHRSVIFGGDLNLRDTDISAIGGLPSNVYDLWEVTGKRPEAKFTWDMVKNDNKEFTGKFKPRCRFDRLYLKHCKGGNKLKPVYFELAGIQRITNCNQFASDHWGILSHFDKV